MYSRDGSSSKCITYDYNNCNPQYKDCVGKNHTNFVFTLHGKQQSDLLTLFIDSLTQRVNVFAELLLLVYRSLLN